MIEIVRGTTDLLNSVGEVEVNPTDVSTLGLGGVALLETESLARLALCNDVSQGANETERSQPITTIPPKRKSDLTYSERLELKALTKGVISQDERKRLSELFLRSSARRTSHLLKRNSTTG